MKIRHHRNVDAINAPTANLKHTTTALTKNSLTPEATKFTHASTPPVPSPALLPDAAADDEDDDPTPDRLLPHAVAAPTEGLSLVESGEPPGKTRGQGHESGETDRQLVEHGVHDVGQYCACLCSVAMVELQTYVTYPHGSRHDLEASAIRTSFGRPTTARSCIYLWIPSSFTGGKPSCMPRCRDKNRPSPAHNQREFPYSASSTDQATQRTLACSTLTLRNRGCSPRAHPEHPQLHRQGKRGRAGVHRALGRKRHSQKAEHVRPQHLQRRGERAPSARHRNCAGAPTRRSHRCSSFESATGLS